MERGRTVHLRAITFTFTFTLTLTLTLTLTFTGLSPGGLSTNGCAPPGASNPRNHAAGRTPSHAITPQPRTSTVHLHNQIKTRKWLAFPCLEGQIFAAV